MMKIAATTLLIAPLLASCAMPGAVMLAGMAIEGSSVMATGKTATDQAISAATKKDCRLLSGLTHGRICPEARPPVVKLRASKPAEKAAIPVARAVTPRARIDNKWTFLIGTFSEIGDATRQAGLVRPVKAVISSAVEGGQVVYRVTAGTFPFEQADQYRARLAGPGLDKIAVMRICPSWMKNESCISLDRVIDQAPQVAKVSSPAAR